MPTSEINTILNKVDNLEKDHDRLMHIERDVAAQHEMTTELKADIRKVSDNVMHLIDKVSDRDNDWGERLQQVNNKFSNVPKWQYLLSIVGLIVLAIAFNFRSISAIDSSIDRLTNRTEIIAEDVGQTKDQVNDLMARVRAREARTQVTAGASAK